MKKTYTYVDFANDCIAMVNGMDISTDKETFLNKALALLAAQSKKGSAAKKTDNGVGSKTQSTIDLIIQALDETPKTTAEINEEIDGSLSPIQISNAAKHIDGVETTKVKRRVTNAQGVTVERLYTAYFRHVPNEPAAE